MDRVIVGTGLIGHALAEAALARGERVGVYNRTPGRTHRLQELGAEVFTDIKALAPACQRIHLALTADAAVDAVLKDLEGHLAPNAVIVDHSTTDVDQTRTRGDRLAAAETRFLHAPLFMSPDNCRNAEGVMLAAGPRHLFDEVHGELSRMTGRVLYVGSDYGRAATLKLVGNALTIGVLVALADAFALAENQGVSRAVCLEFLQGFDMNRIPNGRGPKMANSEHTPGWTMETAKKDVQLMLRAAHSRRLISLPVVDARMGELIDAGAQKSDVSALIEASTQTISGDAK